MMKFIGWFALGIFLSTVNILSITRMVSRLHIQSSVYKFLVSYTFRFVFTGLGLFMALQQGIIPAIIVFVGIVVFRWTLLIPKFRRIFLN